MKRARNIAITGIPRSGTTLLTAMVDSLPDAVALNEPMWQYHAMMQHKDSLSAAGFAKWIAGDFAQQRGKFLKRIPVPDKRAPDGTAVTNYYRANPDVNVVKKIIEMCDLVREDLTVNFTLAMKQTGPYLSILEELADLQHFDVLAIVRHPVGVISSWQNIPIALGKGEMPGAMAYWQEMIELTGRNLPLIQKHVMMYDLMCARILAARDRITVFNYEDLAEDPSLFFRTVGLFHSNPEQFRIKKRTLDFYDNDEMQQEIIYHIRHSSQYISAFYEV